MEETGALLQGILEKTQSDIIIFVAVIAVILISVLLPMYRMLLSARREQMESGERKHNNQSRAENERLTQIINVVVHNTEVMSDLRNVMETGTSGIVKAMDMMMNRLERSIEMQEVCNDTLTMIKEKENVKEAMYA